MENPRIVGRVLLGFLIAGTLIVLVPTICWGEYGLLWSWLALLGILVISCFALALVNAVVFGPILWLMSKFERRQRDGAVSDQGKP